jgi:hypothetical protein
MPATDLWNKKWSITTEDSWKKIFFFSTGLFQTAILVKWSPPPAPKLKLIQTLPECSPICPLSPQLAQISANVPGPYRSLSKKPWFFRYFIFFSTKKRFYSIQISYLESAHKTASNDVWFVRFSNKKSFDKKLG